MVAADEGRKDEKTIKRVAVRIEGQKKKDGWGRALQKERIAKEEKSGAHGWGGSSPFVGEGGGFRAEKSPWGGKEKKRLIRAAAARGGKVPIRRGKEKELQKSGNVKKMSVLGPGELSQKKKETEKSLKRGASTTAEKYSKRPKKEKIQGFVSGRDRLSQGGAIRKNT